MAGVARYRQWRLLNYLSFIGAYGLFLATRDAGKSWRGLECNPSTAMPRGVDCDEPSAEGEDDAALIFAQNLDDIRQDKE